MLTIDITTVRQMIANARRWALARGLIRTNEVHGLEEFKIPTRESFTYRNEVEQRSSQNASFETEARARSRPVQGSRKYKPKRLPVICTYNILQFPNPETQNAALHTLACSL